MPECGRSSIYRSGSGSLPPVSQASEESDIGTWFPIVILCYGYLAYRKNPGLLSELVISRTIVQKVFSYRVRLPWTRWLFERFSEDPFYKEVVRVLHCEWFAVCKKEVNRLIKNKTVSSYRMLVLIHFSVYLGKFSSLEPQVAAAFRQTTMKRKSEVLSDSWRVLFTRTCRLIYKVLVAIVH